MTTKQITELNDAQLNSIQGGFLLEVTGLKLGDPRDGGSFTATDDLWVKGKIDKPAPKGMERVHEDE